MTRIPASPDLPAAVAAARAHLAACADERRTPRRDCRHRFHFPCAGCGADAWADGWTLARHGDAYIAGAKCGACLWPEVRPC